MKYDGKYSYSKNILHKTIGMNTKKNPKIGELALNIGIAIEQKKFRNQDIHNIKGEVGSNIGFKLMSFNSKVLGVIARQNNKATICRAIYERKLNRCIDLYMMFRTF